MAHSSELRWEAAQQIIATAAYSVLQGLNNAEEAYQELFEVYQYAGGTDQLMADQLFQDINGALEPPVAVATPEQVALVTDLRQAIQALHDLYLAANNTAVATEDRAALLRRMS